MNLYFNSKIYEGCEKPMPDEKNYWESGKFRDEVEMDIFHNIEYKEDVLKFESYIATLTPLEICGSVPANWVQGQPLVLDKDYIKRDVVWNNKTGFIMYASPASEIPNDLDWAENEIIVVAIPLPSEPLRADEQSAYVMNVDEEAVIVMALNISDAFDKVEKAGYKKASFVYAKSLPIIK